MARRDGNYEWTKRASMRIDADVSGIVSKQNTRYKTHSELNDQQTPPLLWEYAHVW